jgi:hypothetical protein
MANLNVEVRNHDIVVTKPGTDLGVTYRKHPQSPMLVALGFTRFDFVETGFLVQAWKAAYAKAKSLGWL